MSCGTGLSKWFPWTARDAIPDYDVAGVYLIAQFEPGAVPNSTANPLDINILYIGESGGRTREDKVSTGWLGERLDKFQLSASTGKKGHKGGRTYNKKGYDPTLANIYVASLQYQFAFPSVAEVDAHTQGSLTKLQVKRLLVASRNGYDLLHVERHLISTYLQVHHRLPPCNITIPHNLFPNGGSWGLEFLRYH